MKHLFRFLAISIILLGIVSCDNNNNDHPNTGSITTFNATLIGASEVPPNASTATGSATLTFNNTTKIFTITVTHSIAAPTAAHIHLGAAGVAGDPVFTFTNLTSPIVYTSAPLTSSQETNLKANLYYVNIHSAAFPNGEIRGQLIKGSTTGGSGGSGY